MDLWHQIVEEQLRQTVEVGADTFATLYHGCQRCICSYEDKYLVTIDHYLSIFARSLRIGHEDTYKKYHLCQDPEQVLAEMAPCMVANNVNEEEARRTVLQAFPS